MNLHATAALTAGAFALVEMTATWFWGRRWRNYGVVDAVWSAGFSVLALIFLAAGARGFYDAKTGGFPEWPWGRAVAFAALVVLWSLRLGGHLWVRVRSHHPVEDVRYAELRKNWGDKADGRMLGFYWVQGALQTALSAPFLLAILNDRKPGPFWGLGLWEWTGAALWAAGLAGESVADRQLARFRADPANRGRVCRSGLWNHSRHPNYFFEWMIWLGFGVWACGAPLGWLGLISPALMLHFLVNVTGIPMTEALSVRSKGDAYREYQRTTSPFIPWFKRRA